MSDDISMVSPNAALLDKIAARRCLDDDDGRLIFSPRFDADRPRLLAAADKVRQQNVGDQVWMRGLIEFSNYCWRRCAYCGINATSPKVDRYRLTVDEVIATAGAAVALGYRSFVLQSGEDRTYAVEDIAAMVRGIKELDAAVTLSIGEWPHDAYEVWRAAGADRYLLRIETSDPELYRRLHPDADWETRDRCLRDLKELGYQVGSGVLVGLPGQDGATLVRDLNYLIDLQPDMVGLGPFIPHPDTPLSEAPGGSLQDTLTLLALVRIYLPDAYMPATTAMGSIDPQGRQKALQAGANVMMPNVSPMATRALYQLYPNKICINDRPDACRACSEGIIRRLGREPALGHGHIRRNQF